MVQYEDRWEVRHWRSLAVVDGGSGTAAHEPGGERLAVVGRDGTISVGSEAQALPSGAAEVTHAAWVRGALALGTRPRTEEGGAPSHSARELGVPAGTHERIWRLPLDGAPPVLMADLSPGTRLSSLTTGTGGDVIAGTYRAALGAAVPERRLLLVSAGGEVRDLAPELLGATCDVAVGPDQEVALLQSDPEFPTWYSLLVGRDGAWQRVLPRELRIWGAPAWAPDRRLLTLTAFQGIRVGLVAIDIEDRRWRWLATEDSASYRSPAVGPGGRHVVAVRRSIDGQVALLSVNEDGRERAAVTLSDPEVQCKAGKHLLRRWPRPEGEVEGIFVAPTEQDPPWPLVVDLHGGPVGALAVGDPNHLPAWCKQGFAVFAPDYRASGILGREPMLAAFRGERPAGTDPVAGDVLSGIDSLVAEGLADEAGLFLFGHSWGAYLVNRIVTRDHRFRAAVCWEGVSDLRLLDSLVGGSAMQRAWRGGSPQEAPERWNRDSPIELVERVRTPMLLVYGDDSELRPQGLAWYTALRDHDVPCSLVVYVGEGHLLTRPENKTDLFGRSAAWFRRHASGEGERGPSPAQAG